MTPLAQRITRELTLPVKRRTYQGDIVHRMGDVHCFEISDVYQLAFEMAQDVKRFADGPLTTFLPAPKTWIEHNSHGRFGWLLEQDPSDPTLITSRSAMHSIQEGYEYLGDFGREIKIRLGYGPVHPVTEGGYPGWYEADFSPENLIPAFLLLINSPKVIGRRQHAPHRGLEKRLAAALGPQGEFSLHDWTEIKLEVGLPKDMSDEAPGEGRLTGQKALHFCRSHLRVRLGRLEVVRAHWRGDASLGIKQSRYTLTA